MKLHKKLRRKVVVLGLTSAVLLIGCAGENVAVPDVDPEVSTDAASEVKVAIILNGQLGDEAFFDSANRGAERAVKELGIEVKVIEAGYDAAGWEPALRSAVISEEYDLIITGTFSMVEILAPIALEYPNQRFVFYDAELAGENIHSILYSQNEASYLAGIVAAGVSGSSLEGVNEDSLIGFLGGLDLPVINDFKIGFEQGAQSVNSATEVLVSYAAGFGDPGQGRELAEAQIDRGADVIFQVAGGTGLGVFEAATSRMTYAIGVDSNQNSIAPGRILTSVLKNVDNSLFQAMQRFIAGELPFGVTEKLGLSNGGVGLAKDEFYMDLVPENIRKLVDDAEQAIIAGEIVVKTTLGNG